MFSNTLSSNNQCGTCLMRWLDPLLKCGLVTQVDWFGPKVGGRFMLFCIYQMNWVNCHDSSTINVVLSIITSTPPSLPNKAGLDVRPSVLTYVRPSVCPSVRPSTKSFPDSNEIWYVGRGRWVMHDGMPYDPIQGQGQEILKLGNSAIFKMYLHPHFQCELANDCRFL